MGEIDDAERTAFILGHRPFRWVNYGDNIEEHALMEMVDGPHYRGIVRRWRRFYRYWLPKVQTSRSVGRGSKPYGKAITTIGINYYGKPDGRADTLAEAKLAVEGALIRALEACSATGQ